MHEITQTILAATDRLNDLDTHNLSDPLPTARDWAAFLAALSAFISTLLPLLIPLFTTRKPA